jgi:uncharacterized protein
VEQFSFEFDQAKSEANRARHGIDFVQAQTLWLDERLLRIAARSEGEQRYVLIGMIDGRHWSAVVTYRRGAIRLISVRRSRTTEVQAYEGE